MDALYREVSGGGGVSRQALKEPVYMPALQCRYSVLARFLATIQVVSFHKGVVVSRDGDRREAQFVTPCARGVSSALWPAGERRRVATNWFAQQRRFVIMKGISPLYVQRCVTQCLRPLYPLLILALLVTGIVLAVLIFQYWVLLFALAVIWSVLIIFMTRLLCDKFYSIALVKLDHKARFQRLRSFSASSQFPETPMPTTPLIRVLETIDLSTMDVEQFVEDEGKLQTSTQIAVVRKEPNHSVDMPQ